MIPKNDEDDVLGTLIGLIGYEATFKMVEAFCGTKVYVAHRATENSVIARAVGVEAAAALSKRFSGTTIRIPLARTWRIKDYRLRGLTYNQIASAVGVSDATVSKCLQRLGLTKRRGAAGQISGRANAFNADATAAIPQGC